MELSHGLFLNDITMFQAQWCLRGTRCAGGSPQAKKFLTSADKTRPPPSLRQEASSWPLPCQGRPWGPQGSSSKHSSPCSGPTSRFYSGTQSPRPYPKPLLQTCECLHEPNSHPMCCMWPNGVMHVSRYKITDTLRTSEGFCNFFL